jgi:nucleoside-diphosphate-sugar epimerase
MRIFVAGAGGAIGRPLVSQLVAQGHDVFGMIRSPEKEGELRAAGATPMVLDALDREAVLDAICRSAPEVLIHQLTAIPQRLDMRHFSRAFEATNRLRIEGTDHLLAGARRSGVRRVLAQSFAGWPYAREGAWVKSEEDALDSDPPAELRSTFEAMRHLEKAVLESVEFDGLVLRYGAFYGPGTVLGPDGFLLGEVRRRKFPIVGDGGAVWSFIHVEDAAAATVCAAATGAEGIYNIVDDHPAPIREWLPHLAQLVGAKPPLHVPAWVGRLALGEHGVVLMTQTRGASNARAKRELGWQPRYTSWRDGFSNGLL